MGENEKSTKGKKGIVIAVVALVVVIAAVVLAVCLNKSGKENTEPAETPEEEARVEEDEEEIPATGAWEEGGIWYQGKQKVSIVGPCVGTPIGYDGWKTSYDKDETLDDDVEVKIWLVEEYPEELSDEMSEGVLWGYDIDYYVEDHVLTAYITVDTNLWLKVTFSAVKVNKTLSDPESLLDNQNFQESFQVEILED